MSDRPRRPTWWRDEYLSDPLLYACATVGLESDEVIEHMARRDQERLSTLERLAANCTASFAFGIESLGVSEDDR